MASDDDLVVFNLPDGTEVSNDPRFFARKQQDQVREQIEANRGEAAEAARREASEVEEEDPAEDEDEDFSGQSVRDLRDEAVNRGLEVKGLKKRSEFVQLLRENPRQD